MKQREKAKIVDEKNSVEDINFSKLIYDLRRRMEKSVEELKRFERIGTDDAARDALWSAYSTWNDKEYKAIEDALKMRGYSYASDDLVGS